MREHGPAILVGHSRGGFTVTGVGNAAPDLVDRLVYISAWCCVDATPAEYMTGPEYATSALHETAGVLAADPAELGALRMNWRTADPELLTALKNAVLADGTEDEFLAYLNTLEPDEILDSSHSQARAETWGAILRTYVRLAQDRSIPLALQDRFIREADALTPANPFTVETLESSHAGFLVHPGEAAELLAGMV
ncbi:alpha/beta fold hydrolase [Amycolatopsis sacchari]|uniref:Alpha/beta hydrolase family protein n=1 Tax=Amycolatopsis sacchari TaxID=115433 RepID=A0A1I3MS19_9PSEU|nr:Alpha/beta hydrolase family protein [Amycolatopsis sacchari]